MVDGVSTFFRRVQGDGPPAVFVHGNPTHSEDWQPFLERMRGPRPGVRPAGLGPLRATSPREFDYSMDGLGEVHQAVPAADGRGGLLPGRARLGLARSDRRPGGARAGPPAGDHQRQSPLLARLSLAPDRQRSGGRAGLGEALQRLLASRRLVDLGLRRVARRSGAGTTRPSWSTVHEISLDIAATFAAILRLYRSAPIPSVSRQPASASPSIAAPALVVWGVRDPLSARPLRRRLAERLPTAELLELARGRALALDRGARVVDRVIRFLRTDEDSRNSVTKVLLRRNQRRLVTRISRSCAALIDKIGGWLPHGYGDAARQLSLFVRRGAQLRGRPRRRRRRARDRRS